MIDIQTISITQDDYVSCQLCSKVFKRRGLKKHQSSMHPSNYIGLDAPPACPAVDRFDVIKDFSAVLARAKFMIPVLKHIPKSVRRQVATAWNSVLREIELSNNLGSYIRLLSFAYLCLRCPPKRFNKRRISQIVLLNIADFNRGISLETVLEKYSVSKKRRMKTDSSCNLRRVVRAKLSEGDIACAARLLCSDDQIAEDLSVIESELASKHPPAPEDQREPPLDHHLLPSVSNEELRKVMRHLSNSSAAGLDGLRFRHMKQMTSSDLTGSLTDSLAQFCTRIIRLHFAHILWSFTYGTAEEVRGNSSDCVWSVAKTFGNETCTFESIC